MHKIFKMSNNRTRPAQFYSILSGALVKNNYICTAIINNGISIVAHI